MAGEAIDNSLYGEKFVIFADLLGFSHAVASQDAQRLLNILSLLVSFSAGQMQFNADKTDSETGYSMRLAPNITTFSDHIVISYPLDSIENLVGKQILPFIILNNCVNLIGVLAANALRLGFLLRGGATIGKLYHVGNVVFGEGLIEAFELESEIASYPRIVLSKRLAEKENWVNHNKELITRDEDGIYRFEYLTEILFRAIVPGDGYTQKLQIYYANI